jgi:rRNA maturation RNase YbeY
MIVHGTLHLFGYDHATPSDAERMFSLQERILHHGDRGAVRISRT